MSIRSLALVVTGLVVPAGGAAQGDLTVEFGASQIGPPVGVEGDDARFFMGGVRGSLYASGGSGAFGSVLFGKTLDGTTGASFLSGLLDAVLVNRWTPTLSGSLDARLLAYGVQDPFPFRAFAVEGGPSIRARGDRMNFELSGVAGYGRSQLELFRRIDGPSRLFEEALWRAGATTELMFGPPTSSVGVVGGLHRTPGGDYGNLGGRAVFAGSWGVMEVRIDRWSTPVSDETTGGIVLSVPIGSRWSLRGFFGRTDPDPLTLAQPGGGSGGVLLGRSLISSHDGPSSSALYEIVSYGDEQSRVRISVTPPEGAASVALLGDFTLWSPRPMQREDGRWIVELDIDVGTHHFGFLVDDEWYLPDDAPDVVPDEWGRLSATLVIEGAS